MELLRLDTKLLQDTSSALGRVEESFRNLGDQMGELRAELGSDELAERLYRFSKDWRLRRDDIAQSVSVLRVMVDGTASAFECTEQALFSKLGDSS